MELSEEDSDGLRIEGNVHLNVVMDLLQHIRCQVFHTPLLRSGLLPIIQGTGLVVLDKGRGIAVALGRKLFTTLAGLVVQETQTRHEELGDSEPLEPIECFESDFERWRVVVNGGIGIGTGIVILASAFSCDPPKMLPETPPRLATGERVGLGEGG